MPSAFLRASLLAAALSAALAVSGCDSAEKRAEEHYQNSLALLAAGDVDRALVELRNVFKLNGLHRDARLTYAEVMRETGNFQESYSHYLLLSEQFPKDPLPRKWLFRLAMLSGNLEEARKHGGRAIDAAPEDPEVQAIGAILDYQTAVEAGAAGDRRDAAARLGELAKSLDDPQLYLPTVIDNLIREGETAAAVAEIDALVATDPRLEQWQQLKLSLLTQLDDGDAVRMQLERMVALFPESPDYPVALVQWHLSQGDRDGAVAFLRSWIAAAAVDEKTDRQVQLVAFLAETSGPGTALAELDRLIAAEDAPTLFRAMRAGLLFDLGEQDRAIAQMEEIVSGAGESAAGADRGTLHDIEVNLAQMLVAVGREDEARMRIGAVLDREDGHVGALKMHAGWLIDADRADDAIVGLRTALGRAPEDPEIMSLIAQAHLRNGSRELAGEMLALADETSGHAPDFAIAYARFLIAAKNYPPAETVLIEALRRNPAELDLLGLLGRLYIETSHWRRVETTEDRLRRIGTEPAVAVADALRVDRLRSQGRGEEALRFLNELASAADGDSAAEIAVARSHIQNGNFADAEAFIDTRLAKNPGQPVMRMLRAALYAQTGRGEGAEEILRELVAEDPTREIVWRTLYETRLRLGETEAASKILDEALAALPDAPDLLWAKAGELERDGDVDGAIGIYENLYERLPNSPIVANNLASLLSTHRDHPDSLERAYTIARRLRGTDVPAFQDTYGWIAHLRGEEDEAIRHLEPAARAFPEEAIVQYRLGMAYSAAGRLTEAAERLEKALDLAGPDSAEGDFAVARAELERIAALLAEPESETDN